MPDQPMEQPTWPMVERRRQETDEKRAIIQEKLDRALEEIQRLYGAAAATAEAVTLAIPRQEAEDRAKERVNEQKRLLIVVSVAHAVMMVVLLWVFASVIVSWVRDTMRQDHAVIECLSTTAESTKIANPRAAGTDCRTTAER